jgi:hypothetical protein
MKYTALALLLLALPATGADTDRQWGPITSNGPVDGLRRFIDHGTEVVCYTYFAAIDCLPLSTTVDNRAATAAKVAPLVECIRLPFSSPQRYCLCNGEPHDRSQECSETHVDIESIRPGSAPAPEGKAK